MSAVLPPPDVLAMVAAADSRATCLCCSRGTSDYRVRNCRRREFEFSIIDIVAKCSSGKSGMPSDRGL